MPLLDHRFTETLFAVRATLGMEFGKSLFKNVLKHDLPDFVLSRPKAPFRPPVTSWLKGISKRYGERLVGGRLENLGILRRSSAAEYAKGSPELDAVMPLHLKLIVMELFLGSA